MLRKITTLLLCVAALSFAGCKEEPWVAKVDGKPLTLQEFENYYYANHRPIYDASRDEIDSLAKDPKEVQRNPYLNRQKFLEQYIRQHLVEKMIDEEELLVGDKEYESLKYLQSLSLVVARYSKMKFTENLNVTPEEIEAEYQAHKDYYADQPANKVEKIIEQKVKYDKYQALSNDVIDSLKDKRRIKRNKEIIDAVVDDDPSNDPSEGVLFTIDEDFTLTVDDFLNFYYAQHKPVYGVDKDEIDTLAKNPQAVQQNPLLDKRVFLQQFIDQKLVYDEAMNGEFSLKDDKELEYFIKIQETITKIGYYIKKKYSDELEPTDEEIDQVYQQNKENFQGVPATQIEAYLKPRILQQKLQQKGAELIQNAKEESIIEYNNKTLKSESVASKETGQ
ncbi:MAG: hypothetical protein ACOC2H_09065 [Spirochaetota bacterium]